MVLTLGLGLLTLLGWGLNGLLGAGPPPAQASLTSNTTAAGHTREHRHHEHQEPAASPTPRPSPARSQHRSPATHHPTGLAGACTSGAVTLSLWSPQYWYQAGATPQFTVRARADGQPCRFRVTSSSVAVVVTAAGHRIWSSADCASGSGARTVVVTGSRRVVLLRVSWNRKTSSPGCAGTSQLVRPGEYRVTAVAGHLRSSVGNVVLGAPGASGP